MKRDGWDFVDEAGRLRRRRRNPHSERVPDLDSMSRPELEAFTHSARLLTTFAMGTHVVSVPALALRAGGARPPLHCALPAPAGKLREALPPVAGVGTMAATLEHSRVRVEAGQRVPSGATSASQSGTEIVATNTSATGVRLGPSRNGVGCHPHESGKGRDD